MTSSIKPTYALSFQPPWGWLIAKRIKNIENRTWATHFTGRIYIHSSKRWDSSASNFIMERLTPEQKQEFISTNWEPLIGAIIGEVAVTDCVDWSPSKWFIGPWGFVMKDGVLYDKPIPCKGALKFFMPEIK